MTTPTPQGELEPTALEIAHSIAVQYPAFIPWLDAYTREYATRALEGLAEAIKGSFDPTVYSVIAERVDACLAESLEQLNGKGEE